MPRCAPVELLLAYAAGLTPEAVSLVVATHLALCPACRGAVGELEAVGGALLSGLGGAEVPDALLDGVLARLGEPEAPAVARPAPALEVAGWPEPLRSYVAGGVPWRKLTRDIAVHELPVRLGAQPARLTRLRPGVRVPPHSHRGLELQLVIQGGYTEGGQSFARGDLQLADDTITHELSIDPGEDCITLLVLESPLVQATWRGRLFSWMTGI